jgi:hypothetical protein
MSNGLVSGKIYLKEKEISVERLIFKNNDKIMVFLDHNEDINDLKSSNGFDIHFNNVILINCRIHNFHELKKAFMGCYKIKRDLCY